MAKAVGLNKNSELLILDATAGMGKDAFVFASLGATVIMMERSPISAALLTDALHRALMNETISDIIQRISFIYGDARKLTLPISNKDLSKNHTISLQERPDIIYLDPMFPHRKKSAQVKKEMLAFQNLIGSDNDSDELLKTSLQLAKKRVVVKRPIKAPYLDNKKPSLSMNMKKHRFDVYILV
jgi:16S rRNA (guanine1516-N2)-methyltransferase